MQKQNENVSRSDHFDGRAALTNATASAPDSMRKKCGAARGSLVCDREPEHEGNHRGYNAQIDEPMFWAPDYATAAPTPPWTCIMDFPTACAFVREQHPDPKEHDPRCSWVQASGGLLCDCHVLNDEYARRKAAK